MEADRTARSNASFAPVLMGELDLMRLLASSSATMLAGMCSTK